jgi:hypothetical protein
MARDRDDARLPWMSEVTVRAGRPLETPPIGFQQANYFLYFEGHAGTVTLSYDIKPHCKHRAEPRLSGDSVAQEIAIRGLVG